MKNKSVFISKIISAIFVAIILFSMIIKPIDLKFKIIMMPFLICSFASIGKNICLILEKNEYSYIFSKLYILSFLLFLFGTIIIWSYAVIKSHNYFSLVFTIPFLIIGIYIMRKYLFGIKSKEVLKKKEPKFNFKIIVSSFLVLTVLIVGIICLFIGIRDTYEVNKKTKNYIIDDAYFSAYSIYNVDEDGTTYKLFYTYEIDGKEYTVATDYGVGNIPEYNSIRKVKYNPNNHSEAILVGTNSSNFLIYFGAFFALVGMAFVLAVLKVKGIFDKFKFDVMGVYVGLVFLIIGIGIIMLQDAGLSSFIEVIKSLGIWIFIPIMFIAFGIYTIIKSIFCNEN